MILDYYNVFALSTYEEGESEIEGGEKSFEKTNIELYPNKQKFETVFSNQLFGINGYYFFPGTYDESCLLVTCLSSYKDQKSLFEVYELSPLLRDKIKDWSYGKLVCSVLYYYLNYEIAKTNLNSLDWFLIGGLIQSPAISREVFSFLKQNNIVNFSSKNERIVGFINSLLFPPYSSYYDYQKPELDVKRFYRFLKLSDLSNIDKSIIPNLIEKTTIEQNRKAIGFFLRSQLKER